MNIADWTGLALKGVALLGGFGAIVLAVGTASTWFAKKWVERDFAKDLQAHKSKLEQANAVEIEKVKAGWSVTLSRHGKLLEREFEALPMLWDKLEKAISATSTATSRLQSGASIMLLEGVALDEVLARFDFPESVKAEIRGTTMPLDRQKAFSWYENKTKLIKAANFLRDARNCLAAQSIFLTEETVEVMSTLIKLTNAALDEAFMDHEHPPAPGTKPDRTDRTAFDVEGGELWKVAEGLVRERLGTLADA